MQSLNGQYLVMGHVRGQPGRYCCYYLSHIKALQKMNDVECTTRAIYDKLQVELGITSSLESIPIWLKSLIFHLPSEHFAKILHILMAELSANFEERLID